MESPATSSDLHDLVPEWIHLVRKLVGLVLVVLVFLVLWQEHELLRDFGSTQRHLLLFGSAWAWVAKAGLIGHGVGTRGVDAHGAGVDGSIGRGGSSSSGGVEGAPGARGIWEQLAGVRKWTGGDELDVVLMLVMVWGGGGGGVGVIAGLVLSPLEER